MDQRPDDGKDAYAVRATSALSNLYPAAFAGLSRPERIAVYLTEVEGFSTAELAVVLGTDEATATTIAREAIAKLHETPGPGLVEAPPPLPRETNREHVARKLPLRRIAIAIALIVVVGILGLATSALLSRRPAMDFLSMTEGALVRSTPHLVTADPAEASAFVFSRLGRTVSIPEVQDAEFGGVGIVGLRDDILVPALYYDDGARSRGLKVVVLNYEQIDRLEEATALPPGLLSDLEAEETFHMSDVARGGAAIWRYGADVYVAIGSNESIDTLAARLTVRSQTGG